ncbi:MAG TPA: MBL fold metallo-hydrolase [Phycisphaerae bacterium]|nr:MBL fold metallo-hydrolase [Phycisphaerae bacterium]
MSRTRIIAVASCIGLCAFASLGAAQPDRPARNRSRSEALAAKPVRGSLYQVTGGGGNSFFYVGPDEVLVVDAKTTTPAAGQALAAIRKVTDKPVRRILLTHSDGDHVNGLAGYPSALTIISHANARQDIAQANTAATAKLPLPNETFVKQLSLYLGDVEVQLHHFGPAHTNGDVVVYIPSEKVAIVGDLVFVGRDPLIHAHKKGSSFGLVSVLKSLLQLDADVFLSGHSDPVDRKTVEALAAEIQQKQAKVKALVQEGKTLDEVKAAFGIAGGGRWPSLVEIIYRELTAKK